jgi:ketol-acid reductoisomerase
MAGFEPSSRPDTRRDGVLQCCHEVKLIVDLIYEGSISICIFYKRHREIGHHQEALSSTKKRRRNREDLTPPQNGVHEEWILKEQGRTPCLPTP